MWTHSLYNHDIYRSLVKKGNYTPLVNNGSFGVRHIEFSLPMINQWHQLVDSIIASGSLNEVPEVSILSQLHYPSYVLLLNLASKRGLHPLFNST